jgi:hypothetical protein
LVIDKKHSVRYNSNMNVQYITPDPNSKKEYIDQVLDEVNLCLPAEEEYLAKKTLRKELETEMYIDGICPSCGSNKTLKTYNQNGPDDYTETFYCQYCGMTATE